MQISKKAHDHHRPISKRRRTYSKPDEATSSWTPRERRQQTTAIIFDLNGETFALEATTAGIFQILPEIAVPDSQTFVAIVSFSAAKPYRLPTSLLQACPLHEGSELTIDSRTVVVELDPEEKPTVLGFGSTRFTSDHLLKACRVKHPSVGMPWRKNINCLAKWRSAERNFSSSSIARPYSQRATAGHSVPYRRPQISKWVTQHDPFRDIT